MKSTIERRRLLTTTMIAGVTLAGFAFSAPAFAQTSDEEETAAAASSVDEIVVVGSRIRRDTYNSALPITVITNEEAAQAPTPCRCAAWAPPAPWSC